MGWTPLGTKKITSKYNNIHIVILNNNHLNCNLEHFIFV